MRACQSVKRDPIDCVDQFISHWKTFLDSRPSLAAKADKGRERLPSFVMTIIGLDIVRMEEKSNHPFFVHDSSSQNVVAHHLAVGNHLVCYGGIVGSQIPAAIS